MRRHLQLSQCHSWTKLWFGKHRGLTLPQVMFRDSDWFFWAFQDEVFHGKGQLAIEAEEIYRKARSIHIPPVGNKRRFAEYVFHPLDGSFANLNFVSREAASDEGSSPAFKLGVLDMSTPFAHGRWVTKDSARIMIDAVKHIAFGNVRCPATKRRCEEFFENDEHFDADALEAK